MLSVIAENRANACFCFRLLDAKACCTRRKVLLVQSVIPEMFDLKLIASSSFTPIVLKMFASGSSIILGAKSPGSRSSKEVMLCSFIRSLDVVLEKFEEGFGLKRSAFLDQRCFALSLWEVVSGLARDAFPFVHR